MRLIWLITVSAHLHLYPKDPREDRVVETTSRTWLEGVDRGEICGKCMKMLDVCSTRLRDEFGAPTQTWRSGVADTIGTETLHYKNEDIEAKITISFEKLGEYADEEFEHLKPVFEAWAKLGVYA